MHKNITGVLLTVCSLIALSACEQTNQDARDSDQPVIQSNVQASTQVSATVLEFTEAEAGIEPFLTRMTISEHYIRIDDGAESEGFVLFDRLKKRIFSVVDENESIMVVDPVVLLQDTPADLKIRSQRVDTQDAPEISGNQPVYYQFYANEMLCYHLVAVAGLLPEVSRALQSYQAVLAAQQQETLESTPKDLQTPCFLANYVYAPKLYTSKGFPVEQWDEAGYHRSLSGIEENVSVSKKLFVLPDSYEYFIMGGATSHL